MEVASSAWHLLVGLGLVGTRYRCGAELRHSPDHDLMPMRDPVLTTRQIRAEAAMVLPGVQVRRLPLWRYLLIWHKPDDSR